MKDLILKYARYNQWANARLVQDISTHAAHLMEAEIASSFNSIKKTFMHMADAEYIWHCRLTGAVPDAVPGRSGASVEALAQLDQLWIDHISAQGEKFFSQSTSYKSIKGEPFTNNNFAILWHLFNHGTFHRGQVVTMLRNGGYSGPLQQTDFIAFERT